MIKAASIALVALVLTGCERSPEEMRQHADERIVRDAQELCEPHGGVYRYWLKNLNGASYDSPHVECYDESMFDIRTGEDI